MTKELQTVWCVKYALSSGIIELKGEISPDGYFRSYPYHLIGYFLSRKDYCLTVEEAVKEAERLRIKKIASLERQIAKVRDQAIEIRIPTDGKG
jgi:hypothetical protein